MGDYENDLSAARKSPAFKRLTAGNVGYASADPSSKRYPLGSSRGSVFNQVQISSSARWKGCCEQRLVGLEGAVDDNKASAFTLYAISEASRDVRDTNFGASAASVKEVEAAVRLAEELGRQIVDNDHAAAEAQAEKLSVAAVERLLRS